MPTCIDVEFIFDSVPLGLSSSANILQIADVALRVVFLLFLPCFFAIVTPSSSCGFYSWNESSIRHFYFLTTKTTQPRSHGALTCKNAALFTSFPR